MKQSLVDRIEAFFKKHPNELIYGGDIQDKASQAGYEQSNCARRLRELAAEGFLEVEYIKGKNKVAVAWYRYKQPLLTTYPVVGVGEGKQEQLFV